MAFNTFNSFSISLLNLRIDKDKGDKTENEFLIIRV